MWAVIGGLFIVVFSVLQFMPIEKSNPPIVAEPNWDSSQTRELAHRACFDCHSNETVYPWYADIAPTRLLVRQHVLEGREYLNFSEYPGQWELDEMREVIREGEMPPWDYLILHPGARLTEEEKVLLIEGLEASSAQ